MPPTESLPVVTREAGDTLIVLGPAATDRLPGLLDRLGRRRAYLVTSASVMAGHAGGRVTEVLRDRLVGVYPRSQPHVPVEVVDEVAREARRLAADVIIGLGGGSPIGTAKAAASRLLEDAGGASICDVAAVPTTYAGSEVTPVFGTTDLSRGKKSVVRNPRIRPRVALYDPELAFETPPRLTASTGVNALAHCVEGLYSKRSTDVDREMAQRAAERLIQHLPPCMAAPKDLVHRYRLFEGSMEAGLVLANAGMGIHHGICHVLGARFNAPHGELNAVVLPHAMRFNASVGEAAYAALAPALGVTVRGRKPDAVAEDVCRATTAFIGRLGLPQRLRDLGIARDGLDAVAREALQSESVRNNPRPVTDASQILAILEAAW